MITIITPTGGRPQQFAQCEKYMAAQTYMPDEWIVVDDVEQPTQCKMAQTVIRPQPFWREGKMTIGRNLLAGIEAARGEIILIIEDDDYYAPNYIETMLNEAMHGDLFGEGEACYYNVANCRWHRHENRQHASLCQTGFWRNALPRLTRIIEAVGDQPFVDLDMWRTFAGEKHIFAATQPICVGIKGMPGRAGAGYGHRDYFGQPDVEPYKKLTSWIGADSVEYYRQFKAAEPCKQET